MSLTLVGGGSNRINIGHGASINDLFQVTYWGWVFPNSLGTGNQRFYSKGLLASSNFRLFFPHSAGIECGIHKSTTTLSAIAAFAAVPTYGTNKWCFVACVMDTTATSADQRIFHGDQVTAAAEASSYTQQRVGTGTTTTDAAADGFIGNNSANASAFDGAMCEFGIVNRVLTLLEIQRLQRLTAHIPGMAAQYRLGDNGTGAQTDYSGNLNTGTVTGATASANRPARRRRAA